MVRRLELTPEEERKRACAWARRYIADSGIDPKLRAVRFAKHTYLETIRNARTVRRYGLALGRYFSWCHERGVDPFEAKRSDADTFEVRIEGRDWAPKTKKNELACIRAFYTAAVDDDEIGRNPFSHIRLSAEAKYGTQALTPSAINRVLNRIADADAIGLVDQRDYALLYTASRIGPRRIELGRLRQGQLVQTERGPRISFERKGSDWDQIDLPADVAAVLDEWRCALEQALRRKVRIDDPVFPSIGVGLCDIKAGRRGRLHPMGLQAITNMCRQRFANVGLVGPRMATHVLRASAATIAYENGATIDEIQHMLGHKDQATTWMYIKRLNRPSPATRWTLDVSPFPRQKLDGGELATAA
jgi:integrase/recombinase XerD